MLAHICETIPPPSSTRLTSAVSMSTVNLHRTGRTKSVPEGSLDPDDEMQWGWSVGMEVKLTRVYSCFCTSAFELLLLLLLPFFTRRCAFADTSSCSGVGGWGWN